MLGLHLCGGACADQALWRARRHRLAADQHCRGGWPLPQPPFPLLFAPRTFCSRAAWGLLTAFLRGKAGLGACEVVWGRCLRAAAKLWQISCSAETRTANRYSKNALTPLLPTACQQVEHDAGLVDPHQLVDDIENAGFTAQLRHTQTSHQDTATARLQVWRHAGSFCGPQSWCWSRYTHSQCSQSSSFLWCLPCIPKVLR